MKKFISSVLVLAMSFCLLLPASAASDSVDASLADVTAKVKAELGIGDEYTGFSGDVENYAGKSVYCLNWDGDTQLYVTAGEDGTIYYYDYSDSLTTSYGSGGFNPHFPSVTVDTAKQSVNSFLDTVLRSGETVELSALSESIRKQTVYNFNGTLCVNGVPTDANVSITYRLLDGKIISFDRSDTGLAVSDYPDATPAITGDAAIALYKSVYTTNLIYNVDNGKGRLVYYPKSKGEYVVDASSGKLVDISGEDNVIFNGYSSDYALNAESGGGDFTGLTDAEISGIQKYTGALSVSDLDSSLKENTIFGLVSGFELTYANYSTDYYTEGDIVANLSYGMKLDSSNYSTVGISKDAWDDASDKTSPRVMKWFTLDAKTGKVLDSGTSYIGFDSGDETDVPALPSKVSDYLQSAYSYYPSTELYDSSCSNSGAVTDNYTLAQKVNGYFYPGNYISVTVNRSTGCIDSLNAQWDDSIDFETPGELISSDEALDTYFGAFNALLKYQYVYDDDSDYSSGNCKIRLIYDLDSGNKGVYGVYASDGSLLADENSTETDISYSDIASNPERDKIETLAKYGVGYSGGEFKPDAKLTQIDMLKFFLSAKGYSFDYDSDEDEQDDYNWIYSRAYYYNLLQSGDRNPDEIMTRAQVVRSLISALGYSEVAELKDIYDCGFLDDSGISSDDFGYIALAKGLGIISGDSSGNFRANDAATRQDAAVMLYNLMSR